MRSPTFPCPPPNSVASTLPPYCTALCGCAIHLGSATSPSCHTEGTIGGRGCHTPVLPLCSGNDNSRSAPAWPSVLPHIHYTSQLGRSLALHSPEIPPCQFWACRPQLLCFPPFPDPPSPLHVGFGSEQPVTPLTSPYCTLMSDAKVVLIFV